MMTFSQLQYLQILLDGKKDLPEAELQLRADNLQLSISFPLLVTVISPSYAGAGVSKKDELILEMLSFIKGHFTKEGLSTISVVDSYENIQVIVSLPSTDIESILFRLREKIVHCFSFDIYIGVGSMVESFHEVATSASEAFQMLAYKYQYADRGVINIVNIVSFLSNNNLGADIAFDRVIGCFKDRNLGMMEKRLDELVETVRRKPNVTRTNIRRTLIEVVVRLLNLASDAYVDVDSILGTRDPYHWILSQNHTEIITEWIMQLSNEILRRMTVQVEQKPKTMIGLACTYIEENLQFPELSLQGVSSYVGLSSTYLSELFRQEMGIGFNNYIVGKRIEKAKGLLISTTLTSKDIAAQTGFSSASYFNRVFARQVGISPGLYRKRKKTE